MHRVRKAREGDCHIRTRVLVLAACAAALAVLGVVSCAKSVPATQAWFQLQNGQLKPVAGPREFAPTTSQPWTVQARVSDATFLGDTLYLAVNGLGLARLSGTLDRPSFRYFYDPSLFSHRTVTTLVPRQNELVVHVYFNTLLNTAAQTDEVKRAVSLLSFDPASGEYAQVFTPFQRAHQDWEAVGFQAGDGGEFLMEWKLSGADETQFEHTRFNYATGAEVSISRDAYINALRPAAVDAGGLPASDQAFLSECRKGFFVPAGTTLDYSIRSRAKPTKVAYRWGDGSQSIVDIPIFQDSGSSYALLPDAGLLTSDSSGTYKTVRLPALPTGFHYVDVVKMSDVLVLAWEEDHFTDVGAAGLLLYRP